MLLAVCACTLDRPKGLRRLLTGLADLDPVPGAEVVVVIADNDPGGSSRPVIEDARRELRWEVVYVTASPRGIAHARNAAVEAALAGERPADAVVFLDDDEWPDARWLAEITRTWRETGAEVVTGPVLPVFEQSAPAWATRGRFFERQRFPTGTRLHYARSSNVLVARAVFDGLRFEPTASGGGEDTLFFERARQRGYRIVWADEAIARESVPATRVDPRWLVARSYRYGLTRSELLRATGAPLSRRARRAARGVLTLVAGLLLMPVWTLRGKVGLVAAAQRAGLGAGLVLGALGHGYDDYRVVHGR